MANGVEFVPEPVFFATAGDMRAWFDFNHAAHGELWVGFHKKACGHPSVTWPQSVDVALCFGWIDGVRKNVDVCRYTIRFTPRRAGSIWSAVNIKRVPELVEAGLMQPEGVRAFEARTARKSAIYSYEQKTEATLDDAHLGQLRANQKAWEFFEAQAPWYRRTLTHWVMSAKKQETRVKRLAQLIENSERHVRMR